MVHRGFHIEAAVSAVLLALLWLLYLLQLVAHRCTPAAPRRSVQRQSLALGVLSLLLNTVRVLDPHSVFGVLSVSAAKALLDWACVLQVAFACVLILAAMRSLLRQLQRAEPRAPSAVLAALVGVYGVTSSVLPCIETALLSAPPTAARVRALRRCQLARNGVFCVAVMAIVVLIWIIHFGLSRSIGQTVSALMRVQEGDKQTQLHEQQQSSQHSGQSASSSQPTPDGHTPHPSLMGADRDREPEPDAAAAGVLQLSGAVEVPKLVALVGAHSRHPSSPSVVLTVGAHPNPKLRLAVERCATLSAAMRQFTHLTAWVTMLGAVSVAITINGDQAPSSHTPPDADHYSAARSAVIALQLATMLVIWWMASVPLRPLRDAYAHGRLWRTLCHGRSAAVAPTAAVSLSDDPPQSHPHPLLIITADGVAQSPTNVVAAAGAAAVLGTAGALCVPVASLQQPLDSAASQAVSGLSMRSGWTSVRAVRRDGAADDEDGDEALDALSLQADPDAMSLHARTHCHSDADQTAPAHSQQGHAAEPRWNDQQHTHAPTSQLL